VKYYRKKLDIFHVKYYRKKLDIFQGLGYTLTSKQFAQVGNLKIYRKSTAGM
jgi:hypothetical protein